MTTETSGRNGVNVDGLFAALDAVRQAPEAARFQFRATNEWIRGTNSRSTIHGFYGLGGEQTHLESFQYEADHPEQLIGKDAAPTPIEFLLHALASCITAGIGNIASARGIELTRVGSSVRGDIDLMGLLGLDETVRNGYTGIEIDIIIEGGADAETLRKVVERSIARSAVYDVLTNGTPVTVNVDVA
ncbi:MAG TPA: OsmC family protein [Acidimicrobiia bacterium]